LAQRGRALCGGSLIGTLTRSLPLNNARLLPQRGMVHAENRPPFLTIMIEASHGRSFTLNGPILRFLRVQ
jgi:hypothetical protein